MSNLLKDNSTLMKEYIYDRNNNYNLNTLTLGSKKRSGGGVPKGMNGKLVL